DRPLPTTLVGTPPPAALPPGVTEEMVEDVGSSAPPADAVVPTAQPNGISAPPAEPRRDDARRDDPRRDDRDRRGRRPRRRRGQKGGGRGLPDSKFYSPGPRGPGEGDTAPREVPPSEPVSWPEPVPEAARPEPAEADDFFVLPGESLAKYTGAAEDEPDDSEAMEM